MSISKTAIERAERVLSRAISKKTEAWEKKNPRPCEPLEHWQIAEIAFNDPQWKANAIAAIKRGDSWRCSDQLEKASPRASTTMKEIRKKNAKWQADRDEYVSSLQAAAESLVNRTVIGGMAAKELLFAVEKF